MQSTRAGGDFAKVGWRDSALSITTCQLKLFCSKLYQPHIMLFLVSNRSVQSFLEHVLNILLIKLVSCL